MVKISKIRVFMCLNKWCILKMCLLSKLKLTEFVLSIVIPRKILNKILFWVVERLLFWLTPPSYLKLRTYVFVIVWFTCFKINTVTLFLSEIFNFASKNLYLDMLVNVETTTTQPSNSEIEHNISTFNTKIAALQITWKKS